MYCRNFCQARSRN